MRSALYILGVAGFVAACATSDPAPPNRIVGSPPERSTTSKDDVVFEPAAPPPGPTTASEPPDVPLVSDRRITLDVRDADIHNVLRLLAEEGDVNIVVDENVQGRVTMRLKNVSVEDAFLTVLDSQGLGWTTHGSVTLVERRR